MSAVLLDTHAWISTVRGDGGDACGRSEWTLAAPFEGSRANMVSEPLSFRSEGARDTVPLEAAAHFPMPVAGEHPSLGVRWLDPASSRISLPGFARAGSLVSSSRTPGTRCHLRLASFGALH